MEIKKGMYVRFKDKRNIEYIRQITEIPKDNRYASIYLDREANYSKGLSFKNVIKASNNIFDLIEVGDYVNGELVENITGKYLRVNGQSHNKYYFSKQIKSIVTKEEFESMEYEL